MHGWLAVGYNRHVLVMGLLEGVFVMVKIGKCVAGLVLATGLLATAAAHAGDAAKGEKVFKKCKSCHYVDQEKNKTGPHLVGIIGRAAGSVEGYKYSKAMKESGIVWNEETLSAYLAAPKKYVKGTKMAFGGLKKDDDLANIIAYLSAAN